MQCTLAKKIKVAFVEKLLQITALCAIEINCMSCIG